MALQFVKTALLAAIVFTSVSSFTADRDSYLWLHPKLGYVKVQRAPADAEKADAPAPVSAPAASAAVAAPPDAKSHADTCKPRYWVAPKGNIRRITPRECKV